MTQATPSSKGERTFSNPAIKDVVTFVQTSDESGGELTHLEITLGPGGGNGLHRHLSFSEEFKVLEGKLGVQVGKQSIQLAEGESEVASLGTNHRFFNESAKPVRFYVFLRPGHSGFEKGLQAAYGLARDGKVSSKGIPKNPLHLALIAEMTDTKPAGPMSILNPVLHRLAQTARRKHVDQELAKYWAG